MPKQEANKPAYSWVEQMESMVRAARWTATHHTVDYIKDSMLNVLTSYVLCEMINLAQLMAVKRNLEQMLEDDGATTDTNGDPIKPELWAELRAALVQVNGLVDKRADDYCDALVDPMQDDDEDFDDLLVRLSGGLDDKAEPVDFEALTRNTAKKKNVNNVNKEGLANV